VAAIVLATSVSASMARAIDDISLTDCLIACWIAANCLEMSSVAREVWWQAP
jgi:hypothetical protein